MKKVFHQDCGVEHGMSILMTEFVNGPCPHIQGVLFAPRFSCTDANSTICPCQTLLAIPAYAYLHHDLLGDRGSLVGKLPYFHTSSRRLGIHLTGSTAMRRRVLLVLAFKLFNALLQANILGFECEMFGFQALELLGLLANDLQQILFFERPSNTAQPNNCVPLRGWGIERR
ncbi:hypothetical protein MF271_23130 (plasmid) [Deinococcus sp. KNUC1210]|uniref:hypothetical protein n=1 Tax=Deinococcus sp. KNUC1210 TaxID=2917691 RepID=UPI001EF115BA|nr:hypothetical protein [Deinococcus sp. KNUC1210]ULH18354.1 hypothetical protein MF271_23130 [Deinococcus sp. KNUC1210]